MDCQYKYIYINIYNISSIQMDCILQSICKIQSADGILQNGINYDTNLVRLNKIEQSFPCPRNCVHEAVSDGPLLSGSLSWFFFSLSNPTARLYASLHNCLMLDFIRTTFGGYIFILTLFQHI